MWVGGGENGDVDQPTLALWDAPPVPYRERMVTDGSDRVAWLRARSRGVTATDVARLSGPKAAAGRRARQAGSAPDSRGNAYTDHGRAREPEIARWAARLHGMTASAALFHADGNPDHLATPDGLRERAGILELCEIKTTTSAWRTIPRGYLRQIWWQQYVLGAERTLVIWEQHDDFVPVRADPECRWVERDENEIHRLVVLADELLGMMRSKFAPR